MRRVLVLLAAAAVTLAAHAATAAETAICYNCPPEWADWGTELAGVKADLGITVPPDNKNSGQSLSQIIAERNAPVADVVYYGPSFAIDAKQQGVIQPYKPKRWEEIPAGLKDPDGYWFTIHSGALGLFVNKAALAGKPVPRSWKDLTKPEYKGMVGFLDPSSAFVGYVGAVAVNQALGGTLDDFSPAIAFFKELQKNEPIVPKQTAYARVLSGEIPILFDYDFDAYRAKYKDGAEAEFVIPAEGTVAVPYVMSLIANAPHAENGKKLLDYVLSDKGQGIWANAFLRPVFASAASADAKAKFLPDTEYARVKTVDLAKMSAVQKGFTERYLAEVH